MIRTGKGFYGFLTAGALSLALMAGCGGGGGGGGSTYSISGNVTDSSDVGISGVTVGLTGASTSSTTTDSSGNYTLSGLADGSYTVIPSNTGYTFNPSSTAITVSGANVTGQNFVGSIDGGGGGSTAATGRMPDTNQTTSYTSTFGEDHDYTINPPSYTDNGDGTVTDSVTGLTWQKQDDATTRTWADAGAYCDASTLGGYSDWRLPSHIELISIIDNGVYDPSINTTFFPDTISSGYWSSTTSAYSTTGAWVVFFESGGSNYFNKTDNSYYVRCVRGGETTQSLTDNGNGTVTDSGTLLTWQQGENSDMTWEEALTYCEGLSLAESTDWRLPNHKELLSLVDYTRYSPSINTTFFPNAISSNYWSSTTVAYNTSGAGLVDFYSGYSGSNGKTGSYYARCVRGGSASDDTGGGGGGTSSSWASVSVGGSDYSRHTVAIKTDGTLWAWGYNTDGQLGDGTITYRSDPTQIGTETSWKTVSAGNYYTMAIKTDGTLWAWGSNDAEWGSSSGGGQFGNGTKTGSTFPIQIGTEVNWAAVTAGDWHTVAIKTDGTLWAWGKNNNGQLGDGTTTDRTTPIQITPGTIWVAVSAGGDGDAFAKGYTVAIKSDGTLWAWGANVYGQLGDGTTTYKKTPTQIAPGSTWIAISAGGRHTAAIKNDGTLWTWGNNEWGQLGDGSITDRTTPTQISPGTTWIAVSAAGDYLGYTVAIKSDGTLWAWGDNSYGILGDGTMTDRITPIQIGTETNWKSVSAKGGYYRYTAAIKTDGTMWIPNVFACTGSGFNCGFNYGEL